MKSILNYWKRRSAARAAQETLARIRSARRKAKLIKDAPRLDAALDALEQAANRRDIKAIEEALKRLEPAVAAEPGLPLKSSWRETIEWVTTAVLLALFVRAFFLEAFRIPSGSMEPTLLIGDHLFVNKLSYGIRIPMTNRWVWKNAAPKRGEVAVFRYPVDGKTDYIKRIIAVPGDTLELRERKLILNGQPVDESYAFYLPSGRKMGFQDQMIADNFPGWPLDRPPVTVPPGHYFVMGDNRNNSHDSRWWGWVPEENLVGRAWRIYWSSSGCFPFDGRDCDLRLGRIGDDIQAIHRSPPTERAP